MESNTILYKPLGDVIELLTDYHANGAYEKLKENVTLLDKENHAVMIRTTNFEANDFKNNLIYIDEHAYEFLKKSKVYASDLIMNKIANPGTVYFMPEISKPVSLGMNLFLIRIDPKKANPYFIYTYLRKNEHYVKSFASGSTTKTITKDDVRRLKIYTPPLAEQNKIAQILSIWDQAISITEKLLGNSQQQKKALMQQLLTGKKRLLDESDNQFDDKWKSVSLDKLITIYNVKSTTNNQFPVITSSRRGIYLQDDYFKKQVASEDTTGYKIVPKGYVTFRSMSDDGKFVFNQQLILENALISPAYGVFKFSNINADFGMYLLNSHQMHKQINALSQGGTRVALKTSSFCDVIMRIPTLEEQKEIAKVLSSADQEIGTLQKKLDCLKKEKKALMQQLLTGKKRVKVAA